jgi:hypothetical protein
MGAAEIIASPTRATGFQAKGEALYDAFDKTMDLSKPAELPNTLEALKGPIGRFPSNPELGAKITNPRLQSFYETLKPGERQNAAVLSSILDSSGNPVIMKAAERVKTGGTLTFPELKELRTWIGRQLGDPSLISDIPRADLQQVYGAISRDLAAAAKSKGPEALKAFNRANEFYRAGLARIDKLEGLLKGPPEQAFARINTAASEGSGANAGLLDTLRKSMAPAEWNNVGAATIRRMGEATPDAKDILAGEFSIARFTANSNKLSDRAKDGLFGSNVAGSPRAGLETLARVAQAQKNVDKLANRTRAGEFVVMGGLIEDALRGFPTLMAHPVLATVGVPAAYYTSKFMMSPQFARWVYELPEIVRTAKPGTTSVYAMARLQNLMQAEPPKQKSAQDRSASRVMNDLEYGSPEGLAGVLGLQ